MPTPRGIARALRDGLERDHLLRLVEQLNDAAAELEMRGDDEDRNVLRRRAYILGDIADALEDELGART